jgi:PKD repeat protein
VNFSSASADGASNPITAWNWDFGDGSGSSLQNPSHTYTSAGTYSPTLLATNNVGGTAFGSGPNAISVLPPPQAFFNFVTNNGAITITGYTGGGGVVRIPSSIYGLPVTSIAGTAFRNLFTVNMVVTIAGSVTSIGSYAFQNNYNLSAVYFEGNAPAVSGFTFLGDTMTAYYLAGSTGWGSTIGSAIPTRELTAIAISANPTNGLEPILVNFTAASTNSAGNSVTNWNWDFGDGSSSTDQNPSHTYSAGGTFPVALLETDTNGNPVAGAMTTVTVAPLTFTFTSDTTNGRQPLAVSFFAQSADNGGHAITNWNWDFGDGITGTTAPSRRR